MEEGFLKMKNDFERLLFDCNFLKEKNDLKKIRKDSRMENKSKKD